MARVRAARGKRSRKAMIWSALWCTAMASATAGAQSAAQARAAPASQMRAVAIGAGPLDTVLARYAAARAYRSSMTPRGWRAARVRASRAR